MAVDYTRITARPVDPRAFEVMVRMRDGVRLATDVYLPEGDAGEGPGPTILTRLPYDKNGEYTFLPEVAAYVTARGYRMVVQDVRGKFRSEGETLLFVNEAADGFDTLEWLVRQPWSDGVVGMWGDSYYGYTQLAAASTGHPALRALAPRVTGTRLGALPIPRPGDVTAEVEMFVHRLYPVSHFQSRDTFEWEPDWSRRPFAAAVEEWFATVGERSASYDLWMPHPVDLRRFPFGHPFDAPPVPILQTIGWFDNCAPWQWADVALIAERPGWAQGQYLLIEAIDHENTSFADAGAPAGQAPDAERLAQMLPRYLDPALEFFDVFLRGAGSPDDLPRVRWEVTGRGEVRTAPSWPPPEALPRELHLTASGALADSASDGAATRTWTHDPADLVPSPVQNAFGFLLEYPDERGLAARDDVLVFDVPPVDAPLVLAGPVALRATISSAGPEMDLFARLVDVAPDGAAHLIARGQLTLLDASAPTTVEVDLGHAGYELAAGHALRLTLASSDFPEFVPAPGTGKHRWLATEGRANEQKVVLGGADGAVLRLTVL
ncbi:MAG TPA: CocE/NonD family hydrolase [Solirubrobacteraceae bacterium]|nr:CocE/NonD family hydrolase [Solirubrobacteraceae bacterium]